MLIEITENEIDAFYAADSNFSAMRHGRPQPSEAECDKLSSVFRSLTERIERVRKKASGSEAGGEVEE